MRWGGKLVNIELHEGIVSLLERFVGIAKQKLSINF